MAQPRTPIPQKFMEKEGGLEMTPSWFQFMKELPNWITSSFTTEVWSWYLEFPVDKTYRVVINCPIEYTIDSVTTDADAGTCDLTVDIDGTPLGGSANSVSTTEEEQLHTSDNTVSIGSTVNLTVDNNAGCEGMTVTIALTRTV